MKRADHVFAQAVVHGGFAPHRGIHLRQQRGGRLRVADAPLITGRGKPGHIAHHPASQGH